MKEFAVTFTQEEGRPLYEQIYEAIRDAILSGHLSRGEKLPSTRTEAEFLSCSRSTVALAYDQLLAEGYIESQPWKGYYVSDVRDLYHLTVREESAAQNWRQEEAGQEWEVDFSPNGVDLSQFPYEAMGRIMRNLLLDERELILKSSSPSGDRNLKGAICDYLFRSRSVRCVPEQIVIGAGNEYLLILLSQILGTGHRVAMESPTYLQAYRTFRSIGYPVEGIAMDREGLCTSQLQETEADIAYVMPSHQFPTGTLMPMKRRLELISWAMEQVGRFIIEDDYDSEFRYRGKPVPALQGLDRSGRVIYLGTFSRSIAPSIRISYLVLPVQLLEQYRTRCGFYACSVPNIMQQSIYRMMQEGYFEKNLNRMRAIYKTRHDFLLSELRKCFWVGKIRGENAGLHLLVEVNGECSEEKIVTRCRERNVRVCGLSEYVIGNQPEHSVGDRIPPAVQDRRKEDVPVSASAVKNEYPGQTVLLLGYGGLDEERIRKGLNVLGEAVL